MRVGTGLDWRCVRLACCSSGYDGAGLGGAGKITLVLIKGSELQAGLVCVNVDQEAARGRDGGASVDRRMGWQNVLPKNTSPISSKSNFLIKLHPSPAFHHSETCHTPALVVHRTTKQ
jgi:hypothetical protein